MSDMVERVAKAIDAVQLFSRRNDFLEPPMIEVCRYGVGDEPEIVVLETHPWSWNTDEERVLRDAVRVYRARSAIMAMRPEIDKLYELLNAALSGSVSV